jgi:hypothetical protein
MKNVGNAANITVVRIDWILVLIICFSGIHPSYGEFARSRSIAIVCRKCGL